MRAKRVINRIVQSVLAIMIPLGVVSVRGVNVPEEEMPKTDEVAYETSDFFKGDVTGEAREPIIFGWISAETLDPLGPTRPMVTVYEAVPRD